MTDITKKQYLLSSAPIAIDGMTQRRLGRVYLYTGEKLNIAECKTLDGVEVLVIGNAFCADKRDKCVKADVEACNGKDLLTITRFWTGRWAIITEDMLSLDATGLMGGFYFEDDGKWLVSSSLALVSKVTGKETIGRVRREGLTWQMLPQTLISGVRAIGCFQYADFSNGTFRLCPKVWLTDKRELDTEQKCRAVAEMLVNSVGNIHKYSGKKLMIALTGGKDSRVAFSALLKSSVPFSAYTAEHENISSADKSVPRKLCEIFGVEHKYIRKKQFSKSKYDEYLAFCGSNSNGADANFYACGQFDEIDANKVVIRSGIFELGQTFARGYLSSDIDGFVKDAKKFYGELSDGGVQEKSFNEYIDYVKQNPIDYIDLRDRFYLEQRVGGWVSAIEQSLDINEFTSIQIANCEEMLSVLSACNEKERSELALSYGVIRKLEPRALDLPINKRTFSDRLGDLISVLKDPAGKAKRFVQKLSRLTERKRK